MMKKIKTLLLCSLFTAHLSLTGCYEGSLFYLYSIPDTKSSSPGGNVSSSTPASVAPTALSSPGGNASSSSVVSSSMIKVDGGTFTMGDTAGGSDEKPTHSVTLSSFYIGKYEVTQKEYQSLMSTNLSNFKGDNLPVESVSWFDAIKFCNAKSQGEGLPLAYNPATGELLDSSGAVTTDVTKVKGYRLPTEAEWEYAAKGGNKSRGFKYSGSYSPDSVAIYNSSQTSTVGSKTANELGLYDMSGNVGEWCQDWYDSTYYGKSPSNNPYNSVSGSFRVFRGGSWFLYSVFLLSYLRYFYSPDSGDYDLGFRLVRTN